MLSQRDLKTLIDLFSIINTYSLHIQLHKEHCYFNLHLEFYKKIDYRYPIGYSTCM